MPFLIGLLPNLLAALAPAGVHAVNALTDKYLTPDTYKPQSIDEYVKMQQCQLDMFQAINNAGGTAPTYPWVDAIKQLMRPVFVFVVLLAWSLIHYASFTHPEVVSNTDTIDNMASIIGFYMFGDRTLFYARQKQSGSG